ncbi:MAG: aminotransferase class I/II-fold pyridoxal phosphate-dependent enzyme [Bacteroidales bacterium]|nr:aminotransferase class I/II-fold pyridoxal phosphate-dependent enzyme [Bacteroidales bacterium]MCF8457854.1 aminotransferase class I/II-fold pyridoxal phosphate-dependent enzyme [Bacteroidales bacterium]
MASTKLPNTGFSIFSEMTRKANEYQAINLSQGFPEFDCSDRLKERVAYYMGKGFNQYAPLEGVLPLRESISHTIIGLHNRTYDPVSEITITAGATQAIFTAITAFVREDDEVIVIEPAFDTYEPTIRLNGGRPVFVQLTPGTYSINWDEMQRSVNSHTKMIIINTPHNPSGMTFSEEDMLRLQKIVNGSKILILSDEVYEHIVFDRGQHQSVARYPELAKRSLLISSFGKTYNTTGWKVGYCCAPPELTYEFRKIHQLIVYAANTPIQHAYSDMLADKDSWQNLKHFYEQKRNTFVNLIKGSRFKVIPSSGTYFQLLNYSEISDKPDIDFTDYLVKEIGIAAIPLSVFYHEKTDHKVLRFCFAKNDDTLAEAARKLCKL